MKSSAIRRAVSRSGSGRILPRAFYARETEIVARELLGTVLTTNIAGVITAGTIVETEAYLGEHDPACHAAVGLTNRTRGLYGAPGTAYVYFIYGMYWCVNAVTREEGLPSAVLIRAVEPLVGAEIMRERRSRRDAGMNVSNGPGKLCMALGIDGRHHGASLLRGELVIREGQRVRDEEVLVSPRIGITRAADWPLRFFVRDNPYVSKTPAAFPRKSVVDIG